MERDDEANGTMMEICTDDTLETSNPKPIISGEPLDIEAYAALYEGRTKITRLLFIANNCGGNDAVQLEALRIAYDEIKKGDDTKLFREVVSKIYGRLGEKYGMDSAWCKTADRRADHKKLRLEIDLSSSMTNQIKESIRMGYNDIGDFYYSRGLLVEALKSYGKAREYCTTKKHIIQMCMNAILLNIESRQFNHVISYVNKAEDIQETLDDPILVAKLRCASGLAQLEMNSYKAAARKFLDVSAELGNSYNEVIAPQDVATYGGLCALATFDRSELKRQVINNINFGKFLELVPQVRELINDFYSSRYASCLEHLESLKANLLLDINLHGHIDSLYQKIRMKALVQYTLPFVSISLATMADAFKTTVSGLEKELDTLITRQQIQARIDSHNKILYARHADQRNSTFQKVLEMGNKFDRDARSMLLRASLLKHDYHAGRH